MSIAVLDAPPAESVELVRLTVDQYHQMIAAGVLEEGAPVELIDGLLMVKDRRDRWGAGTMNGPRHYSMVLQLAAILAQLLPAEHYHLRTQGPITLGAGSEPEPDLVVVRGQREDFFSRHPTPADLVLVVEVADTSLRSDRLTKSRLYSGFGLSPYWIVNLGDEQVEIAAGPDRRARKYDRTSVARRGDSITLALDDESQLVVAVDALFAAH